MAGYWLAQQDHTGWARGYAPFVDDNPTYPVWRNVVEDYHVSNDGSGDQTAALQHAMNDDGRSGNRYQHGTTNMPAVVYMPAGTYQLSHTLDLRQGTVIVGDPRNPPTIKAASNFQGDTLVNGYDFATGRHEDSFMTLLKNVILDTNNLPGDRNIVALQWSVAQGCGTSNVHINMPNDSTGHTGMALDGGSTIIISDMQITGGVTGIRTSNQQASFKNISFQNCRTAFAGVGGFTNLLQAVTFDTCGTGVDVSSNGLGNLVVLDSTSTNSGPTVRFHDASNDRGNRNSQVVIQNLIHSGSNPIAVDEHNTPKLPSTDHIDTWVWGNAVPGAYQTGTTYTTQRPVALLHRGKFFTKAQPTYADLQADQVVNVKAVDGHPVKGDGSTDDSASLNAILAQSAARGQVCYFPYGVYIVRSTLFVPSGSRLVGEVWSVISGAGSLFHDANHPVPVVQIGNGESGTAEISELRFTVAEMSPGAIVLQINLAGTQPGDVGLWNCLITLGGTRDSRVTTTCQDQDTAYSRAAFLSLHLSASSSAYVENVWVWTADHDIDGGPNQIISTGRGVLVEATQATWLVGVGSEHHWLYNFNLHRASNVFAGLLQAETPYMQGNGAVRTAPDPWVADGRVGDPDYSWCGGGDQKGRMALALNVDGGEGLMLYNMAFWAFFCGPWDGTYSQQVQGNVQSNMVRVTGSPANLVVYGIATRSADTIVLDGKGNPQTWNNPGGWGGNLVAYREFAG